ncbi:MAG: DUF4393 domain-containing protein [Planctomycetaceae bacterium]|nr:DUF4393 domain-containing protein [Planctomycetaceae bacterium]
MPDEECNNKVDDTINAVTDLVKAVPIYQDAIQPAAKEIGKGLEVVAKAINVALEPIRGLVWGYDKIKEHVLDELPNRLKSVAPDKIITPSPNVAVPTLEALRYTGHQIELRELFLNLLTSSMNSDSSKEAFPSFVEIIKQMTPDEAKLLDNLVKSQVRPLIDLEVQNEEGGAQTILTNYSHFGVASQCTYPELTPAYLNNLCRLGILEIPYGKSYTDKNVYVPLSDDLMVKSTIEKVEAANPNMKAKIIRKVVLITDFGWKFIDTCVIKKTVSPVKHNS